MLLLIKIVLEYCQCADDLPMLVTEVLMKMIDMLKVGLDHVVGKGSSPTFTSLCMYMYMSIQSFNNRTHELVLRAGAMESVGLKTITARHLGKSDNRVYMYSHVNSHVM